MPPERDEIAGHLARIPELAGFGEGELTIRELGGTTNRNFQITSPAGQFALRIPAEDRAAFVNRPWEVRSAQLAAEAGIGAPVVYADQSTGLMLTRWVDGLPLSRAALRGDASLPTRVGRLLRALHGSEILFPRRFDAFAIMQNYRQALIAQGRSQVRWSGRVAAALARARVDLGRSPLAIVPSHCDPVPQNVLDVGPRLVLVDWEYAGMNDPGWDLAYFALESDLDLDGTEALLAGYADERVGMEQLRSWQLVAAALGVLWGELRDPSGENLALAEWARARLEAAEILAGRR